MIGYILIFVLLLGVELVYFRIADRFNIIDKPNERSSHSKVVLRGGGLIFPIAAVFWCLLFVYAFSQRDNHLGAWLNMMESTESDVWMFVVFVAGLLLVAVTSFIDDLRSLPDSVRLAAQFVAMGLMFWSLGLYGLEWWWVVLALVVCVGITNVYNFMDGINGITGGYSLVVLVALLLSGASMNLCVMVILSDLVFCVFNFRSKNKAKCFAGDVGSVSMAFILLYLLGGVIVKSGDLTYLVFLVVYGVDACLTIVHRIMLRENLGVAHRKHAYQIMSNELGMSHIVVSGIYMGLQLAISLAYIYFVPVSFHWVYLGVVVIILSAGYLWFMKKFYHLHEEYLRTVR